MVCRPGESPLSSCDRTRLPARSSHSSRASPPRGSVKDIVAPRTTGFGQIARQLERVRHLDPHLAREPLALGVGDAEPAPLTDPERAHSTTRAGPEVRRRGGEAVETVAIGSSVEMSSGTSGLIAAMGTLLWAAVGPHGAARYKETRLAASADLRQSGTVGIAVILAAVGKALQQRPALQASSPTNSD